MKKNKKWFYILLLAFSFSVTHEFVFALESHCDANEYIAEFKYSNEAHEHKNICSSHYEYHHSYILSESESFTFNIFKTYFTKDKFSFISTYKFDIFTPPKA